MEHELDDNSDFCTQSQNADCKDCVKSRADLGAAIHRRRKALGWTLEALSVRSGVQICTISKLERGVIDPKLSTVNRVLTALPLPGVKARSQDKRTTPPSGKLDGVAAGVESTCTCQNTESARPAFPA